MVWPGAAAGSDESRDEPGRNAAPPDTCSQRHRQGTCGRSMRSSGALRSHIGYLLRDEVARDGSPGRLFDAAGDEADGRAFAERWKPACPGSGKADSVVDLRSESEVRRDPLRECKSVGCARATVPGEPAGPKRWVLSNEAEQRLHAPGERGELSPFLDGRSGARGLPKCAAEAIGSYL
jgi:hypothetical protein